MLAYSALSLYMSKSLICASIIGTMAAAIECEQDGNVPIPLEKVIKKLLKLRKK